MKTDDGAMLYQAYVFRDEKRVKAENYYVTTDGVVYRQMVKGVTTDLRPVYLVNITRQRITTHITAPSVGEDRSTKVEEIMCATFDCDENTPYEYTNGLKRYIYLDGNPHNCSIDNMKSCDFWEYMRWAHDNGIRVSYTHKNREQVYERFLKENITKSAFSEKYHLSLPTLAGILKYKVPIGLELECTDSIGGIIVVDGKVLYRAYMFENGKRVQLSKFYISKDGVVYKKYNKAERKYKDACPVPYVNTTTLTINISTGTGKTRKVEEIMCATFDCDENTPYEYTNGLKRYIYLDGNPHNCSIDNMKSCDFWEYMRWANDTNISTPLTKMNRAQIYDRFSEEKLSMYAFAKKI